MDRYLGANGAVPSQRQSAIPTGERLRLVLCLVAAIVDVIDSAAFSLPTAGVLRRFYYVHTAETCKKYLVLLHLIVVV